MPISEWRYPTAFSGWDTEEHEAIQRVIASTRFTMGDECAALEAEFASYFSRAYAIATNSGSSANLLVVAALVELGRIHRYGSSVAVPALAWSTTFSPLVQHGLSLCLQDIDTTWNAAADSILAHLIVGCSILGNPTEASFWLKQASRSSGIYIEDCCESIGARYIDGTLVGSKGLASTFSFFHSHQLSAIEGGMILTDDPELAKKCRKLKNHGWLRGIEPSTDFGSEYRFDCHGYNLRPLELHAAIARVQLRKLSQRRDARWHNYQHWLMVSAELALPVTHPALNGTPSPFGIHFQVADSAIRSRAAAALRAEGIDCRPPVGGSFRLQPYGKPWSNQLTPKADEIHHTGMMLGLPPFPWESEIERAAMVLKEALT